MYHTRIFLTSVAKIPKPNVIVISRTVNQDDIEGQKKSSISTKIESLHNKVDKMIRLLSDVTETQKKNSKVLMQLQKANEAQAQKELDEIEKVNLN